MSPPLTERSFNSFFRHVLGVLRNHESLSQEIIGGYPQHVLSEETSVYAQKFGP